MLLLAPEQKSRLQDYCATSVFIKVLMLRGYGFDEASFPQVSFQKKVRTWKTSEYKKMKADMPFVCSNNCVLILQAGDASVGWALGYMLSLSSLLPAESVGLRKALTPGAWGTLLFLFILLLTSVLVFVLLQAFGGKKKGGSDSGI